MSELQTVPNAGNAVATQALSPVPGPLAQAGTAGAAWNPDRLFKGLRGLSPQKRLTLLIALPMLLGLLVAATLWSTRPDYKVLFTSVNETDGGAIINSLKQMGVPYQYSDNGGAILVPADKVYETRLQLASQGLPKGSVVGFELFENQKMGVTQFQEQVNFQRGLEGELIRSIQSLDAVHSARVHLALPKNSVFLRDQQKPTASIVVNLNRGKYLSREQVDGIVHLVASSVPQLSPRDVSIVDQTGALLTANSSPNDPASLTADQMAKVQKMEDTYNKRIMDLLVPIVGDGNVRASVTAKVNFKEVERSEESYKPNNESGNASIRSQQQSLNAEGAGLNPQGVPGMISNSPGETVARIGAAPNAGNGANNSNSNGGVQSRESLVNYEVDREIVRTKSNQVDVAQINAAVLLNYKSVTNSRGETREVPFTPAELASIQKMVSDALGIDANRGDTLSVLNQSFVGKPESLEAVTEPLPWQSLVKNAAVPLALSAVALGLIFGLLRPMLKSRDGDKPAPLQVQQDPLMEEDSALWPEPVVLQRKSDQPPILISSSDNRQVEEVQRVVRQNPELAANIVKSWIGD
ncbi:MAG TPA: flagellar basal-body MS-ring/collar protein FliF [Limnobacter sp.]|uniref:flagellar basal-body MS-ring/collar protein FliF n=1 Tax=Limnobacter sp. TaxID=2003368 RepID=UPI002EDAEC98